MTTTAHDAQAFAFRPIFNSIKKKKTPTEKSQRYYYEYTYIL